MEAPTEDVPQFIWDDDQFSLSNFANLAIYLAKSVSGSDETPLKPIGSAQLGPAVSSLGSDGHA
jgi:hypothetical protein